MPSHVDCPLAISLKPNGLRRALGWRGFASEDPKTPLCFEWRFLRERWRCALRPPGLCLGASSAGFPMSPFLLLPARF